MKRNYQRPAVQTIKIQQQGSLLSGVSGELSGYGKNSGSGFSQTSNSRGGFVQDEED